MDQQFTMEALMKLKQKRRRKTWRRILSVMMCIVVFWTTYALILPAITMETDTFCGIKEHIHEEGCYEKTLLCQPHVHNEQCYQMQQNLICTLSAEAEHMHSETCNPVTETTLICEMEEIAGHSHTENCEPVEQQKLICLLQESEEHTHEEGCYITETIYTCGQEEVIGHAHGDSCYTTMTTYGCGLEEVPAHVHEDGCYETAQVKICTLNEDPKHEHVDACYDIKLICEQETHEHVLMCYSDPNADLETASDWESTLPEEQTGVYAEDILAIAKSQLGYTESTRNYVVTENDDLKGYTRYGAWYGDAYGDWCAMFVSFCLHYAGVEEMPLDDNCPNWIRQLSEQELYKIPSEYIPKAGDLIFFDWERDDSVDHVGLVENVIDTEVFVIEGNSENRVTQNKYDLHEDCIVGYGTLVEPPMIPEEDSVQVDLENAGAWAVLVEPEDSMSEVPQEEEQEESKKKIGRSGATSTYSLRKNSSTYQNSARAVGTPLDLTPYINSVVMYDEDEKPIANGSTVTEGDLIEFRIEYTVTGQQLGYMNGEDVTVVSDTLVYKIPSTFQIIQSDSGNIVNSSGQTVGTFLIDSDNGTLVMSFLDSYVQQNASGMQIQGNISFFSTVTKITESDQENQDYEFTDKITLGIVIKEETEVVGDLEIEKDVISVDGEELTYRIKVTSAEGTNGSITITDTMAKGLTFVKGLEVRKNGVRIDDVSFDPATDGKSFSMTLPEMAAGDSYTLSYTCMADVDLLDSDLTARNTATVTGKDNFNNELKDETTVEYTFELVQKRGQLNEDGSISWTITVNHAKADISGWILEDNIRTGNVTTPYTGPVTITDSSGRVVAQNVTLPYTFPEGSEDTYTVTYTTDYAFGEGHTIYNTAILHDKDNDTGDQAFTGVDVGSPFTKTGVAGEIIQDENGNYLLPITWTITVDTTNAPISGGLYFRDTMEGYYGFSDMYMTYEQLWDALENFDAVLKEVGGEVYNMSAWVYQPGAGVSDEVYNYLDFYYYNTNDCRSKRYESFAMILDDVGIPEGHVLTFTYETYGLFPNNIVSTTTFKNRFNLIDQYEVEGVVEYMSGTIKATKYAMKFYDPNKGVGSQDWALDWSGEEGTSRFQYEELIDSYLAWGIELSTPLNYTSTEDLIMYEDLPDGVTVTGLDLKFLSDYPTKRLMLRNIELDNTYTWDFSLYPVEQYGQYQPTGAQGVSIVVEVTEAGDLKITLPGALLKNMGDLARHYDKPDDDDEWYGYLYIYTQINEDFEWTPTKEGSFVYVDTFKNQFTIANEDGKVYDIGSQSQIITKDERDGVIRKEATTDRNNIITYSVILNSYGKDLIENSGNLLIHDELTYTSINEQPLRLRLVPGSVKLYEIKVSSDGSYTKLGEVTAKYSYNEISEEQGERTNWTQTIDMVVPDGKALLLEYSYKASGDKDVTHDVLNTCTISGVGEGSLDGETKVEIEVKEAAAQADTAGIMLYKVDANSDGLFLKNAKFNIYIWNEKQQKYIIVHHPNSGDNVFVTNDSGMIVLDGSTMAEDQFAYNTAYYIVEVESPNGYYLSPEPYYFYIANQDTTAYPPCMPRNFEGHALVSGDIIYRQNVSETTEISVEKYWKGYDGDYIKVDGEKVSSITLELWQMLEDDPESAKVYGTYTMTPDEDGNWSLTITDLPKATKQEDGTRGTNYLYYIKEVGAGGFVLESSENNAGINYGIIKLVNREQEGYDLPQTGGTGTQMYTTVGLLLMLASAASLLYIHKKGGRGNSDSS